MTLIETLSPPQPVSMADEWFQFATADHFWMQWRHHLIVRAVKSSGIGMHRALEVGCGNGTARQMLERDLGIPIDGCDLNQAALEMAKPGRGRLFVYNIFDQEPSLLERYDALFLLDVIEHIRDDLAFLAAALKHLRQGGLLVVNVPAGMLLFSDYDRVQGHVKRYTATSLVSLFNQGGVENACIQPWGLLMVPFLLVRRALLACTKPKAAETIMRRGFMPPNAMARKLLHGMKNVETALPFRMPFGTSVLAWGRLRRSAG